MSADDIPIANQERLNQEDCSNKGNKIYLHSQNGNHGIGNMDGGVIKDEAKIAGKIEENNNNQSHNTNIEFTVNIDSQTKTNIPKKSSDKDQNNLVLFEMIISGELLDANEAEYEKQRRKIENIIKKLRDLGEIKYNFEVKYVKKGSIKIGLEGHLEDFNKLQELFNSGQLNEILGTPVEDISLVVAENSDNDEEIENEEKSRLVEEIISKGAKDLNLSDAKREFMTAVDIQNWLVAYVAEILEIDQKEIDITIPLERYGLDSSEALVLSGDLQDWLECDLDPELLFDYQTIEALVKYLSEEKKVMAYRQSRLPSTPNI